MRASRAPKSTTVIFVALFLCFAILSVGLFWIAADYAEGRFPTQETCLPSTDTAASPQSSEESVTDETSDWISTDSEPSVTDETVDSVFPMHGEEYSTSPLPQWCHPQGQWCTEFAVWCIIQAQEELGVEYINVFYPKSDYSGGCIQWFNRKECYYSSGTYVPRRGDMIFFEYDGDKASDHTGLVTGVEYDPTDGKLYVLTIEGNLPEDYPVGVIRERRLAMDDKLIFGYGTFPYQPTVPQQGEAQ